VWALSRKQGDGKYFPLKYAHNAFQAVGQWGYEQGWNETGLTVGMEPWPSKLEEWSEPRLLGSDIVRLVLEQCGTAKEALSHAAKLIETYGQGKFKTASGASVGQDGVFLFTDHKESFILEAAGRSWAAFKVKGGIGVISHASTSTDSLEQFRHDHVMKLEAANLEQMGSLADARHVFDTFDEVILTLTLTLTLTLALILILTLIGGATGSNQPQVLQEAHYSSWKRMV